MAIHMTARFKVRPESLEKCKQAISQFVEYIKQNESGTRLYIALQEGKDPTSFLHLFIFEDEAARDVHKNSDAVKRFTDILYPQTLASVEFTEYTLVASNRE